MYAGTGIFPMDCPMKDGCSWVAFVVLQDMSASWVFLISFINQLLHFSRSIAVIWCLVVVVNFDSTPSSETPQTKSYFLRASTVDIFGTRYNVSLESVSEWQSCWLTNVTLDWRRSGRFGWWSTIRSRNANQTFIPNCTYLMRVAHSVSIGNPSTFDDIYVVHMLQGSGGWICS